MAAVAGPGWLQDQSAITLEMSPTNCADRPIRPLPKRRIRARLSEEEADSIVYPPVPSSSSPDFESVDQNQRAVEINSHVPATANLTAGEAPIRPPRLVTMKDDQLELESDDDNGEGSISRQRSSWSNAAMSQSRSAAHYSTASSGDGYESFENTNNKKKRKIPQHQHGASGQFPDDQAPGLPMSPGAYQLDGAGQAEYPYSYDAAPSVPGQAWKDGTVIKGSRERQPLLAATSVVAGSRSETQAEPKGTAHGARTANRDIRVTNSNNTRKSASEKPSRLQKHEKQSYDFTFERQSQSSNRLSQTPRPTGMAQSAPYATPLVSPPLNSTTSSEHKAVVQQTQQQPRPPGNQPPPVEQPPPLSRTEQYRLAAQDRRRSQRAINVRQLREKKEVTLCEFCEFKAIWLYTPRFLIRRYEERDLKRRQDIENRRRLLEKAKAKSRKTKKGGKGQKGATPSQSTGLNNPTYDPAFDDGIAPEDAQSPGEEYFDDDEFDENGVHQDDYGDETYGGYPPPLEPIVHANNTGTGYAGSGLPRPHDESF